MSVIIDKYCYEVLEVRNKNGNMLKKAEADELEAAKQLSEFLSCVKSYTDDEIKELSLKRKIFGLTNDIIQKLYDAYFDLIYYGNREKNWFLTTFHLSEKELRIILA